MDEIEKAYTTKEVSLTLDIGTSTLRKWCLSLEENGYSFARTESNKRLFVENDLVALKHYKVLLQEHNFTLGNAAMIVISKFHNKESGTRTPSVPQENEKEERSDKRSDDRIDRLIEYAEKQEQFNRELVERLDAQQKHIEKQQYYIEERLKERDEKLMDSLRTFRETKQEMLQIAATKEEKKNFFSRLFGK